MNFEETLTKLYEVLPFKAEENLLKEIVMKSSFIEFEGAGEKLFKAGDPPLGFYWILEGPVEIIIPEKALITLEKGDMAGLDSFLTHDSHSFNIVTAGPIVQTLFINRVCFDYFREKTDFRKLINRQILYHMRSYRGLLSNTKNLLLKY